MVRGVASKSVVFVCLLALPAMAGLDLSHWRPVPRIVNGQLTNHYATTGALLVGNPGVMLLTCSATLIGCETLLTAAHCVCASDTDCQGANAPDPSDYFVYLQHGGIFGVSDIDVRSDFDFPVGDVAVIHLSAPVSGIAPTPLDTAGPPFSTAGTIVGFGRTGGANQDYGIKRVGAVETEACENDISDTTSICWEFATPVGPPGTDSNTCNGDSGGPMFVDYGSGPTVAGVTSGGFSNTCLADDVSFDAKVAEYSSWIQTQGGADLSNTSCGTLPQVGAPDTQVLGFDGQLSTTVVEETHSFQVGPGVGLLRVSMNGHDAVENDFDLYVRAGSPPTTTQYDCIDATASQFAFCKFSAPTPGTWYFTVRRFSGQGQYQATVTLFGPDCTDLGNAGEPCEDGNPCTGNDVCQSGSCVGSPIADGTPCDDGNPCTRPDTCNAGACINDATPLEDCRTATKSILLWKQNGGPKDRLVWKWIKGQATSPMEFADPTTATDYTLCVYAGTTSALVADARIPGGPAHWTAMTGKGYRYSDPSASSDGIKQVQLKASDHDAAKILIKGSGAGLADPQLSLGIPVKVQLVNEDNDRCWQSDFDGNDVLRNDFEQFKAKSR